MRKPAYEVLKEIRKEKGIEIEEVAYAIQIPVKELVSIESGSRLILTRQFKELLDYYGVRASDFIKRQEIENEE